QRRAQRREAISSAKTCSFAEVVLDGRVCHCIFCRKVVVGNRRPVKAGCRERDNRQCDHGSTLREERNDCRPVRRRFMGQCENPSVETKRHLGGWCRAGSGTKQSIQDIVVFFHNNPPIRLRSFWRARKARILMVAALQPVSFCTSPTLRSCR